MKTGIVYRDPELNTFVNLSNNKIPEFARDYKKEYLYIRGLNKEFKYYIQDKITKLRNNSYEENWGEINIYKYILNLVGFINNYINNPSKDNLKIVDWYFIDLIINKDKIIVRGVFYELGLYIEDDIVSKGLLELESLINEKNE